MLREYSAAIMEDAVHIGDLCDAVIRRLPQWGEPLVVLQLRLNLGADSEFRVDAAGPDGSGPWLVYLDSVVDRQRFHREVLQPLAAARTPSAAMWPAAIRPTALPDLQSAILEGYVGIILGNPPDQWLAHDVGRHRARSVAEPSTEKALVGPKEGFVEHINTNLALMREWLPDESFQIRTVEIGRRSHQTVAVCYVRDVVRPGLVPRILKGLRRIRTDFVRDSLEVAEYLVQGSASTFPLVEPTERPDRAVAAILEGRVAILVERSPFALLLPATLLEFHKDSDSALPGPIVTAFVRGLRLVGSYVGVFLPGFLVALLTVNSAPLRPPLALAVSQSRSGLPYPVATEMLFMLVVVDVFTEATAQQPGGVGNALTIVGTLIIGQMAVAARLASELVMIASAAAVIGSFLTLRYHFGHALRIWKYPVLLLSAVAGLLGWVAGGLLLATHLASLKSAGVPYLAPLGPLNLRALATGAWGRAARPRDRRPPTWKPQDPTRSSPGPGLRGSNGGDPE